MSERDKKPKSAENSGSFARDTAGIAAFPKHLEPRVLWEDPNAMAIDKPAGLLSQGEIKGDPNLVDWLRARLGRPYVGLIHRLDRNTSGLMVVAKRTKAANRLTSALQAGKIRRSYLAWVEGELASPTRWKHYLRKDPSKNLVTAERGPGPGRQEALLSATPVGHGVWQGTKLTLVEFVLETGRSHQIRAQSSREGLPLLGDRKYGGRASGFPRTALHSASLEFPHPISGEVMKFESPLPADMAQISSLP